MPNRQAAKPREDGDRGVDGSRETPQSSSVRGPLCNTPRGGGRTAAPANAVRCPSCGTPLEEFDLICSVCGTKLKRLPEVEGNPPPRARELRGIAAGAIANAIATMMHGRKMGVKLTVAENLLENAKQAAMQGNFAVALELASRSGEQAENLTTQFEALQTRLRNAKREIESAKEDGIDTTESDELIDLALAAGDAGDYKSALRYAIKAAQTAMEGRSGVQAWRVEIGDWLK